MSEPARKSSLFVLFLVVFIDLLGFGIVLPLLPIYANELLPPTDYSAATQGWVIGLLMASFSAMQFVFAPLWGRVSDAIGRRPVLLIGLAGSAIFYLGFGVATAYGSLLWIFVTRIGAGMAGATISTAQAYIADSTTPEKRARGMALIGAAFGLGFTFGPLIGVLGFVDFAGSWSAIGAGEWSIKLLDASAGLNPRVGYLGAVLSTFALVVAFFKLPESRKPNSESAGRQWFDMAALRGALAVPSIVLLLLTSFVSVFSFANFESTLSLLVGTGDRENVYDISQMFLLFAYVGFVLSLAQGFLVRRLAGFWREGALATAGAVVSIAGFGLLAYYTQHRSTSLLLAALAVVVVGFAFLPPTIQSLISRRSDPEKQGGILGLGQSVSALARILGPLLGIRLFKSAAAYPYWVAMGLMVCAMLMVGLAVRGGKDFE